MAYFDYNATTPLNAAARQALLTALDESWVNPSSPYGDSARVHNVLEKARHQLVKHLQSLPSEIVFTGGATEGNNAVIRNLSERLPENRQLVISPFEHPSVVEPAKHYFKNRLQVLESTEDGSLELNDLKSVLQSGTVGAVSVMAANNESGVILPWRDVGALCQKAGVLYHCDASQVFGKCEDIEFIGCDFLVGCGHKFGGPKGVGFLALSESAHGLNVQLGGSQESGKRGGTENVPSVLSMISALAEAVSNIQKMANQGGYRDDFEGNITVAIPGVKSVGNKVPRLPNTSFLIMPRHENLRWVRKLDVKGFQVSTGSACSTGSHTASPLLTALRYSVDEGLRTIRVSSGPYTTRSDWQSLAEAFGEVWQSMEQGGDSGAAEVISI